AAEQRAAEQAAAERRAAERRAAGGTGDPVSSSSSDSPSGSGLSTDGGFLGWPVTNTYVTSPYGMRLHPILHIWKLHDGTDFHAVCGTPVYAAADGRVMSEYYSTGYGNQLVIDHGLVNGVSLATSYNHLTSFVVGTGQQVSRGQIIAYSGTTGYSTGCHLHFMVYVNGATVDPMTWL
ncbi:MAG: M23 family metallopeptidase, partial [Nocardioidaceae bacterium]